MNKVSKKTAKVNREASDERAEYVRVRCCVIALLDGFNVPVAATDCHEIKGGWAHRHKTKLDKRYWLAVSRRNHDRLQGMSKELQWAIKVAYDTELFDVTVLSERQPFVDAALVLVELHKIMRGVYRKVRTLITEPTP